MSDQLHCVGPDLQPRKMRSQQDWFDMGARFTGKLNTTVFYFNADLQEVGSLHYGNNRLDHYNMVEQSDPKRLAKWQTKHMDKITLEPLLDTRQCLKCSAPHGMFGCGVKMRACKECGSEFMPENVEDECCSHKCILTYTKATCSCDQCWK